MNVQYKFKNYSQNALTLCMHNNEEFYFLWQGCSLTKVMPRSLYHNPLTYADFLMTLKMSLR